MKKFKKTSLFFILVLCLLAPASVIQAAIDIFGYFENRAFVIENPDESWKDLGEKLRLGDYNRLRMQYKASPSKKVAVNVAVDFYSYHGMINTPLWIYIGPETPTSSNVRIDLDRAYVDLYFKKMDISIGKQRVALGVSYLWAPLDIFSRVNVFEPKEEKSGSNAVKVYVPLGNSSALTGVFSPDTKLASSTSAFRAQTQLFGVDAALTLIRSGSNETSIYGLDLRGENFIGWWVETGYFVYPQEDNENLYHKKIKLVLGFDYTFPVKNGLYWLNEFYYDTTGEKDPADYDFTLSLTGERFTLGQRYFLSMLSFSFTEFLSASLSYIANWDDGSFLLSPALHYDIAQNIQASAGFYLPLGPGNGEYKKYQENTFFLWLKVNF
jgi:hypothetical protein